jgi:hypothetical protein
MVALIAAHAFAAHQRARRATSALTDDATPALVSLIIACTILGKNPVFIETNKDDEDMQLFRPSRAEPLLPGTGGSVAQLDGNRMYNLLNDPRWIFIFQWLLGTGQEEASAEKFFGGKFSLQRCQQMTNSLVQSLSQPELPSALEESQILQKLEAFTKGSLTHDDVYKLIHAVCDMVKTTYPTERLEEVISILGRWGQISFHCQGD